ncbi:cell division protein ZapA [Granulicatella seriolae]|uniref:Cell division protein ZapA n=1 Tax=Granulicatella seriolae TaxID=2967226 RepID=A0ABT1WL92_9LACT|nr:cell division protein ZapA [Granulicatella seriolae]
MAQAKRRFRATIAGKTYTIVGTKSDQHMKTVETLINEQLQQLQKISPSLTLQEKTVLLCVNAISDQLDKQSELIQTQEELADVRRQLAKLEKQSINRRTSIAQDRKKQLNQQFKQEETFL